MPYNPRITVRKNYAIRLDLADAIAAYRLRNHFATENAAVQDLLEYALSPGRKPSHSAALAGSHIPGLHWGINHAIGLCHNAARAAGWWSDLATGKPIERNKGELLMLIVSELAEAMEGERKGLMDVHLPHRRMAEVETADAAIRLFDYAGGFGYDLAGAITEKLEYNRMRADHQPANRRQDGGKKF